MMKQCIILCC